MGKKEKKKSPIKIKIYKSFHKKSTKKHYVSELDNLFFSDRRPQKIQIEQLPAARPKPADIRLQDTIPCSKFKIGAMKYMSLAKVIPSNKDRTEAMDYIAADAITYSKKKEDVIFHRGVHKEKKKLIPDERLEDMKKIVNKICKDYKVSENSHTRGEIAAAHTLEKADNIRGHCDYTEILLDDILNRLRIVQSSEAETEIEIEDMRHKVDAETSPSSGVLGDRSEETEEYPETESSGKPCGCKQVKGNKRTVGTQTMHPELMELILRIWEETSKNKKEVTPGTSNLAVKPCTSTVPVQPGTSKLPPAVVEETDDVSDDTAEGQWWGASIATQTSSGFTTKDIGVRPSAKPDCICVPKSAMIRDVMKSLEKMSKIPPNIQLKKSRSGTELHTKSPCCKGTKDKCYCSKCVCPPNPEVTSKLTIEEARTDAFTQVRERKPVHVCKEQPIKSPKECVPSTCRAGCSKAKSPVASSHSSPSRKKSMGLLCDKLKKVQANTPIAIKQLVHRKESPKPKPSVQNKPQKHKRCEPLCKCKSKSVTDLSAKKPLSDDEKLKLNESTSDKRKPSPDRKGKCICKPKK